MKKIIAIVLVTVLMICACVNASADDVCGNAYTIDNTTVIFDENSQFSVEQQEMIAHRIVYSEENTSTYGLMCTLFGHKNTSETVTAVTHKYNVEAPRCLEEIFLVTTCSRCGETTTERTGYRYISCCPEE